MGTLILFDAYISYIWELCRRQKMNEPEILDHIPFVITNLCSNSSDAVWSENDLVTISTPSETITRIIFGTLILFDTYILWGWVKSEPARLILQINQDRPLINLCTSRQLHLNHMREYQKVFYTKGSPPWRCTHKACNLFLDFFHTVHKKNDKHLGILDTAVPPKVWSLTQLSLFFNLNDPQGTMVFLRPVWYTIMKRVPKSFFIMNYNLWLILS